MKQKANQTTTTDALMGGTVTIEQPENGFRAGIDAVLLSACPPMPKTGEQVLDVGAGVGSAGICYGVRTRIATIPNTHLHLIEQNDTFTPYGHTNMNSNGLSNCATYHTTDISIAKDHPIKNDSIHHILTNPPYETAQQGSPSPYATRTHANIEGTADLPCWIKYCNRILKRGGTLSMIHRADRVHDILSAMNGYFGDIHILPVQSLSDKPAIRVLIHAKKGMRGGCILHQPLILQKTDKSGDYTEQAEQYIRHGEGIDWGLFV